MCVLGERVKDLQRDESATIGQKRRRTRTNTPSVFTKGPTAMLQNPTTKHNVEHTTNAIPHLHMPSLNSSSPSSSRSSAPRPASDASWSLPAAFHLPLDCPACTPEAVGFSSDDSCSG